MGVRKIFIVLITIVICVIIGAFVINVIMPNTVAAVVNTIENSLWNATGMKLDLNGDGTVNQTATAVGDTFGNVAHDTENVMTDTDRVQGYQ